MRLPLLPLALPAIAHASYQNTTAQDIIQHLHLQPNVEGGYFRETFRDARPVGDRSVSTAIYYLLEGSAGWSYWHRVDAVEVWCVLASSGLLYMLVYVREG
jgi:predicted cupin superfamily sugar epimerase